MELYLLRHGQSEYNVRRTEHLDSDLTDIGRQQAERTAERLAGEALTRVYVSPLRRALQTIAPTCGLTGLRAEVFADVCEYFSTEQYRNFPGLSPSEIVAQYPFARLTDDFPCTDVWWPQEIEDLSVISARALRVREALLRLYANTPERVLVVSHAETVGRLTEAFLRLPPAPDCPYWPDNCALARLHCTDDPAVPAELLYFNDTAHLGDLRT